MNKILIFIVLLILVSSCNAKRKTVSQIGGTIIECKFPSMAENGETSEQILHILKTRLSYFKSATTPTAKYNDTTEVFRIEVPGIENFNADLFLSYGQIDVCETYRLQDVKNNVLDSIVALYSDIAFYENIYDNACILNVREKYIKVIDSVLQTNRSLLGFPYDLRLCWGWQPVESASEGRYKGEVSLYPLYMIKKSHQNLNLSESHIKSKIENESFISIGITLNDLGGAKFAQLTQHNVANTLAMVADGKVFSAPRVMSRIDGGKLQISGGTDIGFTEGLLALLNTEKLKSKAEIISVDRKRIDKDGL